MFAVTLACLLSHSQGFYFTPYIHGEKVVYSSEGDLWLGDLKTMTAQRLTSDSGTEDAPKFSPDGKWIAFNGEYDGKAQAYVMPVEGGLPKRLTMMGNFRSVTGWSHDSSSVIFRARGYPTSYRYYSVPAAGGASTALPLEFASHVDLGPIGGDLAFTRLNRWSDAWFYYDGGMQNQIWVRHDGRYSQVTSISGTNEYPQWLGSNVYFVNEQKAQFTLMSVPGGGGSARRVAGPWPVEARDLGSDGKRLVFRLGPDLELYDPKSNAVEKVEFSMAGDFPHERPFLTPADRMMQTPSLTPSGKRVLAESRGQIISVPNGEGESRVWKSVPGARLRNPMCSPDGKLVAYISSENGDQQIFVAAADGSGPRAITKGRARQIVNFGWAPDCKSIGYNDSEMKLSVVDVVTGSEFVVAQNSAIWIGVPFDFSPDSKWLTYAKIDDSRLMSQVYVYEIATKRATKVSDNWSNDVAAAFSSDGKWLAYLSQRDIQTSFDQILNQLNVGKPVIPILVPLTASYDDPFAAKDSAEGAKADEKKADGVPVVRIDLDGIASRKIEVPATPGLYTELAFAGNRLLLASGADVLGKPVAADPTEMTLRYYDLAAKQFGTLTEGYTMRLSADRSKLLAIGNSIRVVDPAGSNIPASTGAVNTNGLQLKIDPKQEWKVIYEEAWQYLRDYFYVANMHGANWNAIHAKYAAMLPMVRSRGEVDELIRWLQAELGSSHEYVLGGDTQEIKPRVAYGYLGIDVVPDASPYYKISKILRGDGFRSAEQSPLAKPNLDIHEGMYLIEVAGVPAKVGNDVFEGLIGRAGQVVSVKVNQVPSEVNARTVYVKVLADENRIRYLDWVQQNRDYVAKASGGRIGYLHMASMMPRDMNDFVKQYFAQRNKDALMIDVRFNTGGNIQDPVNRILSSTLQGFFNQRNSPFSWTRQSDYFVGPMACLINEFNISCGEEFPLRFKDLKRGPLIGRRTMGGEVGSDPGWPLVDGGTVFVPNYGMYKPGIGWVIEGRGVEPDIDVPSDPNAFVKGIDPQLDRAVQYLLEEIKKHRKPDIAPPKDRVRIGGGG